MPPSKGWGASAARLLAACAAALSGASWLACTDSPVLPAGSGERPDVVLVSIDTLRADHLSAYGYERETSPFLDELAAKGFRFHWARSASPWTLPAHVTMLTGQLPSRHRVVDVPLALAREVAVLPEAMRAAGWKTAGFVSTLYVSRVFGFERGFDHFVDFEVHDEERNRSSGVTAQAVVDRALAWWSAQDEGAPVFLFLHFYDVHTDYDPPPPYRTLFDRAPAKGDGRYRHYFHYRKKPLGNEALAHQLAQYDEAIRYVDDQLRRVQEAGDRAGRRLRWVVTSDHGEELGERGSWGHAHTLYAEQLRVPLILSGGGIPVGEARQGWAGTHDIAPTILGWARAHGDAPSLAADGLDLAPVLRGEPLPARPFPAETTRFSTNRLSLLEDGQRLEWDLLSDTRQLFEPGADPAERSDLAGARPDAVARLAKRIEELLGHTFEAREAGWVWPEGSVALASGRRTSRFPVAAGTRFVVLPYDGQIRFTVSSKSRPRLLGPWRAMSGTPPAKQDPVRLLRTSAPREVEIDEGVRRQLESLGYLQEEPGETP